MILHRTCLRLEREDLSAFSMRLVHTYETRNTQRLPVRPIVTNSKICSFSRRRTLIRREHRWFSYKLVSCSARNGTVSPWLTYLVTLRVCDKALNDIEFPLTGKTQFLDTYSPNSLRSSIQMLAVCPVCPSAAPTRGI